MRRTLALGLTALCLTMASGCERGPTVETQQELADVSRVSNRPVFPVPKALTDLEAMSVPYVPGSEIRADDELNAVSDRGQVRVYTVRLYAPGDLSEVGPFYLRSLQRSKNLSGTGDTLHIQGANQFGDAIEIRLAPAADPKKTLVLAFVSVRK